MKLPAIFLSLCALAWAACVHDQSRVISVTDASKRIERGYLGFVRVRGFYYFHLEEDTLFPRMVERGSSDYEMLEPRIELSFERLLVGMSALERFASRKEFGRRFAFREVEIIGEIKHAPLPAHGPWGGQLVTRTFLEVTEIKEPNKSLQPTLLVMPRAPARVTPSSVVADL